MCYLIDSNHLSFLPKLNIASWFGQLIYFLSSPLVGQCKLPMHPTSALIMQLIWLGFWSMHIHGRTLIYEFMFSDITDPEPGTRDPRKEKTNECLRKAYN